MWSSTSAEAEVLLVSAAGIMSTGTLLPRTADGPRAFLVRRTKYTPSETAKTNARTTSTKTTMRPTGAPPSAVSEPVRAWFDDWSTTRVAGGGDGDAEGKGDAEGDAVAGDAVAGDVAGAVVVAGGGGCGGDGGG